MTPNWMILKKEKDKQEKFFLRAKILSLIRDFFSGENFLEVETPSLVALPGMEPHLDPVRVSLPMAVGRRAAYLITSPEYAMKKILAAGFKKIFEICKSFRGGETMDDLHNPEFTILEWYRANADYTDIMVDVESLFLFILKNLLSQTSNFSRFHRGSPTESRRLVESLRTSMAKPSGQFPISNLGKNFINYQGEKVDLTPPWPRLTVRDVFWKYAGVDLDKALTRKSMARAAKNKGYSVSKDDKFDDIFFKIFLSEIEPRLGKERPVILYDWPAQMAALSRRKKSDPRYAERFEVYIGGLELGNAFSELTDPAEQRERLVGERKLRKKLGKKIYDIDEDFIRALEEMPPSGGIAMGVDRIVMLFANAESIDEVLFFPANQIFI